jgi:DNA-binding CsgD family transcriptional regulator/Tfp pilus assembly protein PilF
VPDELARRGWRLTGGNPLLLDLAARTLDEQSTSTETDELPVSGVERSLVLTRFAGLTPDATRWARAAAVLGIEFRPELVADVADLEGNSVEAAAEAVWRGGLVRAGRQGRAEFVHPLFGQLLYEDTVPPVRARLHARAFTALTKRGTDDAAAEHAIRANLAGDSRAVRVLTEAGQRALRAGALATAVSRLEAAVRLSGKEVGAPLVQLGEAYLEGARGPEAASTLTQALDTDLSVTERVAAHILLSKAHFGRGAFDGAAAALHAAVALADHEYPERVVRALRQHALAVMMTAGPAAALPLAARARELARSGDPVLEGTAGAMWGNLAYMCGDPEGLVVAESEARRVLDASAAEVVADLRSGLAGAIAPFAIAASYAERFADADATLRSGIDEAERAGWVTNASALWIPLALMRARTRSGPLLPIADRLLALADLIPLAEPFGRTLRSYELLELGNDEESEAEQASARHVASASGIWPSLLWLDHIEGLRLLRRGQFGSASEIYLGLEKRYRSLGVGEPCIVPFGRHAVLAHTRAGRLEDAERVVSWLDQQAGALPCRWPVAAAAAGRATLAVESGDLAKADERYRTAVELLVDASLPLEQAEIMIEHGTVLRRQGRPRQARESFRRAAARAESGGGQWLARHAGDELAAAGGRRREQRGAHELTPQEQRAAKLAATGASDKEIAAQLAVSVRTVRTHLDHVYAKLGLHSRRDLMTMGDRLETIIGRTG